MRIFLLLLLFTLSPWTHAQSDFFAVWPGHPAAPERPGPPNSAVTRVWTVELNMRGIVANTRAVSATRVRLPDGLRIFRMRSFSDIAGFELFGEDDFRIRPGIPDSEISYRWVGVAGAEQLTIAVHQGVMSATLTGGETLYSLIREHGEAVLQQLDVLRIPPSVEVPLVAGTLDVSAASPKQVWRLPDLAKSSLDVVDVLVLHTPGALAHASIGGDLGALNSRIAEAFLQVETVMDVSGMNTVRMRNVLAGSNLSVEVPYDEVPGNTCVGVNADICRWIGHRIWLRTSPLVQSLRDSHGADLVVMLIADQQVFAGVSYPQNFNCGFSQNFEDSPGCDVGAAYAGFAFAAVSVNFATSFQVFAHETGHQFGMQHQSAPGVVPAHPWSFAKTRANGQAQTVVGGLSLIRTLQYSNPNVFFVGTAEASGDALRFNARTAFCLAPVMSGFRAPGQVITLFWEGFETRLIPAEGC